MSIKTSMQLPRKAKFESGLPKALNGKALFSMAGYGLQFNWMLLEQMFMELHNMTHHPSCADDKSHLLKGTLTYRTRTMSNNMASHYVNYSPTWQAIVTYSWYAHVIQHSPDVLRMLKRQNYLPSIFYFLNSTYKNQWFHLLLPRKYLPL